MSILIDYIAQIDEPKWEVITYKLGWWQIRDVNMRIVFCFHIRDDNEYYRIDYNVEDEDIIFCRKRPKELLLKLGIDPKSSEAWLQEQKELLKIFLNIYSDSIKTLIQNNPPKPKWYKRLF